MAERAHPDDPAFQGTAYERALRERYAFCLPFVQGKKVLDVPCGTGWGTSMLTGAASLAGVDADPEAVRYAASRFSGIDFRIGCMEALPLESNCFDVVVCLEGLEHLYLSAAKLFLAEARRVLRGDGTIIVTVPLLKDGRRHSGNPYHFYEYTQTGLGSLLEQHFETVSLEIIEGVEGSEVRYVGQPAVLKPGGRPPLGPDCIDVCIRSQKWLDGMKAGDGFRFSAATPCTLLSTCIAILLHEGLESLESVSQEERKSWCLYVQSCQDPSTGRFLDPLLEQYPIESELHNRDYIELLMTYFAIQALDALGVAAVHPSHFLAQFESPGAIAAWLDRLDWSNPWLETNRVMFVLAGLIHRAEKEGNADAPGLYHQVLDWLDRAQDPQTGLWGTQQASLLNKIAAAYHLVPFYEYVHRPVRCVSRIIDAALSLQQDDGLFGASPGGGACEDLDVIDLLATFTSQVNYRASDIKRSLIRGFWSVWNLQNADGGFPYAARASRQTYRFGSWAPLESDLRESDVFASWFRLMALETVRCTYPEDLPEIGPWRFRRWPALGFHHLGLGLAGPEKEALSVWLRPLSLPTGKASDATGTPDVTVVITCYNLGRYLHEAIDSVLRQTLQSFEIIVVDDGSADEFTTFYLDLLSAPGTRVIRTPNRGLPAARNAGIQLARGRYICCLDADDRLMPAFLERARRILDDAEDVGFVSCYYETFDCDHAVYRYDHCRFPELLVQNEAVGVSVFRKDAWRKVGGYCTALKAMQDWDFWIGIVEQGYRGEVIPEILFEYRARIGSMYTVTRQPENYSAIAGQIFERHQDSYRSYLLDVLRLKTRQFAELVAFRQGELEGFARTRNGLEAQVRNWQQVAEERDRWIAELEKAKTWLAQQVDNWREVAGQQNERIAHLEDSAEERDRWIAELEAAKTSLAESLGNRDAAVAQQVERIAALEETVAQMRATRVWRAAERAVGVLRSISGICRGMILVGSPKLASSNAKNLLLGMKLVLGGGEGRATWDAHFDATYYKWANPDVARTGIPPWLHYLLCGYFENRNPSGSFDSAYYRSRHLDVRDAGINPLLHYAVFGRHEERNQAPPLVPGAVELVPGAVELPVPAPLETPSRRWLFVTETAPRTESTDGPLVSVVIPCFNYGQYVEQAIRSVLSQTFTNLEIIVVEGGSTDGTTPGVLRALEQSGLPRTRFVYRTESHLVGDNRNFGIGLARGRYVCCLDADDLIKPNYVEIAVFLAEFGGYDMVYPSVSCFGGSDFRWLLCDPTWPEIADGNQASTVAMFRKAAWEHVGGFRDWGKGDRYVPEDWEFWVRLIGHGFRGKSIREPLMLYRAHHGGLWSTCELPVEQQRQAIREANPQLFVNGSLPATRSLERPVPSWDRLIEPAGSHPPILIALPFITIGGAEKLFATLARTLVARGYRVVVITTLVLAKTIRDCTDSFEEITPYLYPLPRLLQNQEECWADFLFYLLKRHDIGTILIAGCDFVYRLLPEIAREFPEIAVLDQLFNDEVHYPTNRHYAAYIDTTLVPAQTLADKLISEAREQAGKVCVIPHGIDIEEMTAPDAAFDSSGLPESFRGKFLVSFFGRLSAEKSPADFVKIARLLRAYDEIRFLMTGEGQERASVLALIEKSELQDRIHVPGFVDDVRDLMSLSDVVVVPSSVDGMPLVVFEAQAFSKPVVASAVGSIPHVIADGRTGFLCKPGDVEAFAARILELWRSPELRRAMGDAARVWVCANHSAESMTARYVKALDEARSRRQRGTSQPTSLAKEHPASLS